MAEIIKVLYIVVIDDEEKRNKKIDGKETFRYTRSVLQSTLQLMGCKPRYATKISERVFGCIQSRSCKDEEGVVERYTTKAPANNNMAESVDKGESTNLSSELYKRRTTVFISRNKFLDIVCDALAEYKYIGPNQRDDLILASRIRERKESLTVLLCGTSGCGKSTLSSILASRLGITTVMSTDSIRHMMRSYVDEKTNPLLWASTYHAGECLDPVAVAEAKARRKARKMAGVSHPKEKSYDCNQDEKSDSLQQQAVAKNPEMIISPKQMAVEGFKAQSEMVIESLERLIPAWEERKESVIVEGVHLSLNFVMGLMKKHPSIVPFMIYIQNEEKHMERFAVRAKYMALDPSKNKYVKYIRNIRRIQEYLCNNADKHLVPKINNTNVDKSVATIHATLFSCLRRRSAGHQLYDPATNTMSTLYEEYKNQCTAHSWSSKGILQLIQRKGSSRRLMAVVNDDGSIAKAWPVDSTDSCGTPVNNDSLQIGKAESVNLQFGHFGISAWRKHTGGTSHASSFDESRTDWGEPETSSRGYSSCCSSPHKYDGPAKWVKEELSVSGSDEEIDDHPEMDSDEDLSDDGKHNQEEFEGSVDEESIKSDEEYDERENGYYDEEYTDNLSNFLKNNTNNGDIFPPTLNMFLRAQGQPLSEKNCSNSSILEENIPEKNITPYFNNILAKKQINYIS